LKSCKSGELIISHLKARLFAIVLILVFAGLTYYNWQELHTSGSYSTKLAAFGPVGVVGGLFLMLFPGKAGKPTTTLDRIIVLVVFVVGLAAGLINWYLLDPGFFGR
jgi:NhaP-type Na+/H+ or K+/H+ antiporter